jgi:hypothetical protein
MELLAHMHKRQAHVRAHTHKHTRAHTHTLITQLAEEADKNDKIEQERDKAQARIVEVRPHRQGRLRVLLTLQCARVLKLSFHHFPQSYSVRGQAACASAARAMRRF